MENIFHPSGQTSNSLDKEIDELKVSKHHAVVFQVNYFSKVIGGGGGVLFLIWSAFYKKNGKTVTFFNLWKFVDTSGLTLLCMVTVEVHVRLGCLMSGISLFFPWH